MQLYEWLGVSDDKASFAPAGWSNGSKYFLLKESMHTAKIHTKYSLHEYELCTIHRNCCTISKGCIEGSKSPINLVQDLKISGKISKKISAHIFLGFLCISKVFTITLLHVTSISGKIWRIQNFGPLGLHNYQEGIDHNTNKGRDKHFITIYFIFGYIRNLQLGQEQTPIFSVLYASVSCSLL